MKLGDEAWSERHRDWQAFERIELEVVPRYKTSGLSGDEWRTSVRVRFFFKGEDVYEEWYRDMQTALMMMPSDWIKQQEPIPSRVIDIERTKCFQPGCAREAVSTYHIKQLFDRQGHRLDMTDQPPWKRARRFCALHLQRGDCGRDDSDANYEVIAGPGPERTRNVTESPSVFGGAVMMPNEGEEPKP